MRSIINGVHRFKADAFENQRELYQRLAGGQHPEALFITCSDSRLVPNVITQTNPGDLFTLRNAGNIVPPHGAGHGGEAATLEYAIEALGVRHIIICGHTKCGAIKALIEHDPATFEKMPAVKSWLEYAEATRRIVVDNYSDYEGEALLNIAAQEHVLVQLENVQTHPSVAAKLARGHLTLHGWIFKLETADVFAYSDDEGRFLPLVPAAAEVAETIATN